MNQAYPKDEFPLSIIKLMLDATTGYEVVSFMNVSSEYNKIWMNLNDKKFILFDISKGIYCYKVVPFRLKGPRVAYQ